MSTIATPISSPTYHARPQSPAYHHPPSTFFANHRSPPVKRNPSTAPRSSSQNRHTKNSPGRREKKAKAVEKQDSGSVVEIVAEGHKHGSGNAAHLTYGRENTKNITNTDAPLTHLGMTGEKNNEQPATPACSSPKSPSTPILPVNPTQNGTPVQQVAPSPQALKLSAILQTETSATRDDSSSDLTPSVCSTRKKRTYLEVEPGSQSNSPNIENLGTKRFLGETLTDEGTQLDERIKSDVTGCKTEDVSQNGTGGSIGTLHQVEKSADREAFSNGILGSKELPAQVDFPSSGEEIQTLPAPPPPSLFNLSLTKNRAYAFNAKTAEEERQRASLVEACEGLSSLCSQWHQSDYNKLKHGQKGAPMRYCPLTIVHPDVVQSIMEAQAKYEREIYSSEDDCVNASQTEPTGAKTESRKTEMNGSTCDATAVQTDLDESLGFSMVQSLDGSWVQEDTAYNVHEPSREVAQTRPIGHHHNPTSEVPALDHRVNVTQAIEEEEGYEGMAVDDIKNDEIDLKNGHHVRVGSRDDFPGQTERVQQEIRQAMEDSIGQVNQEVNGMNVQPGETSSQNTCNRQTCMGHPTEHLARVCDGAREAAYAQRPSTGQASDNSSEPMAKAWTLKTSDTHPITVSLLLPFEVMPAFVDHLTPLSGENDSAHSRPLLYPASDNLWRAVVGDRHIGGNAPIPITAMPRPSSNSKFGNLLLSSCPGKKVRLSGPVKGRAAICRDLRTDLFRIKEMGVGCVICCLDDNELTFLGAPWQEYRQAALQVGLNVVRIPMPEGLTPASLPTFDEHIERVIRNYTLRGIHVLAHCRAGVGRAGLTACAWAVKLGIVGPSPDLEPQFRQLLTASQEGLPDVPALSAQECENARVMSTVERVICLIRLRRSFKAIETFEQVNFLASYVAWLRQQSGLAEMDLLAATEE